MPNNNVTDRHRKMILKTMASIFTVAACSTAIASTTNSGQWGIGVSFRHSTIPYKIDRADSVGTVIPQIFYEGETIFLRDLEWGVKAYEDDENQINAVIKRRFVSIPHRLQNQYQEDSLDWGVQWVHRVNDNRSWRFEALTETRSLSRSQFYAGHDWQLQYGKLELKPRAGLRYKSKKFNSYYYGLSDYEEFNGQNIGAGIEAEAGVSLRYPLLNGLYLTGSLEYVYLDANARHSPSVDSNGFGAVRLGFVYFDEPSKGTGTVPAMAEGSYLRGAHGWATPSDMGDILSFQSERDPYNNQMSSVFYGHPLRQGWLGYPVDIYLHSGIVYHYEKNKVDENGRKVQDPVWEGIVSIKAYYNFTWPIRWRFGLAEGLSYVSKLTYNEWQEMDKQGSEGSKLMNYLDVSFDANVGDLFRSKSLENLWAGYSMHHRSSIFKQASQFGRIKGGSNFNTFYLQYHF